MFAAGQVFPSSQGLTLYLCFLMGPLSLLNKVFLWSLLTYASPGWFPFLNLINIIELERLHRAASCTISVYLLFSLIPLLLSEVVLSPLRVILTHFTLSFYERTFCLTTCYRFSYLARPGVKPRLCRSSWRAFASIHSLTLLSTFPREALLACPLSLPWNLPSFTVEFIFSSPPSPPLSCQGAILAHLDPIPPYDLVL